MVTGIIGKKVGMTQLFLADGTLEPATVLQAGPCVVVQAKTAQDDGYEAVQIGFVEAKRSEREQIQTRIQQASAAREAFVQQALAERLGDAGLGAAMRQVIREQAKAKGFTCEGC